MKTNPLKRVFRTSLLLLFVGLFFTASGYAIGEPAHKDPYKSRSLTMKNQKGEQLELNDLEGKVVFINFWATWCPPCIAEMPSINKLYKHFEDDEDIVFLMITLDRKFDTAIKFLDKKGFAFDIHEPQGSLPNDFQTRGIPNTYVLGKDGKIEYKRMGMGNYNTQKFKDFLTELKEK